MIESMREELDRVVAEMSGFEVGSVPHTKLRLRKEELEESIDLQAIPVSGPTGGVCVSCEG